MTLSRAYRVTLEVTIPTVDCLTLYFTEAPTSGDLLVAMADTVFASHERVHEAIARHGVPVLADDLIREEVTWPGPDGIPLGWLEVELIELLCPASRRPLSGL